MTPERLLAAGRVIARRNATSNVTAVAASLESSKLILTYFLASAATDEDREFIEICCAEILGEFPEIRTAETRLKMGSPSGMILFLRD